MVTTASQRSWIDAQAPMGYATKRTLDRVPSACGMISAAQLEFKPADDLANGGVLLADAPQPAAEALEANPDALRFTLVVDREGYSPALFAELLESRIGLLTYRKKPGDLWPGECGKSHVRWCGGCRGAIPGIRPDCRVRRD